VRKTCQDWFLTYLDARIVEVWPSIASRVLCGVDKDAKVPDIRSRVQVYGSLVLFAQALEKDQDLSLRRIVARLKTENFIRDDAGDLATQLAFQYGGWLTALFDPDPSPSVTHLTIRNLGHSPRRRSLLRKTVIQHPSVVIADGQLPLQRLLRRFGSLLPEPQCVRRPDAAGGLEAGSQDIVAAYVYFHNLKLLNVELEWVDVLNQHLEFDRRSRSLRVFRLPSICRLMYREEEGSLLDGLCHEDEHEYDERSRSPHPHCTAIEEFLGEVILSYRLIFGRHRRSRALLTNALDREKDEWRRVGRYDPLLEILCTKAEDCREVQEAYGDLDGKELEDYVTVDEFPFLAGRLLDLQNFSMAQNPHSWKRLWNDQRNITVWFTTWAVVIIGGGTLLFQILQLVFQIYQPLQQNNNSGG
jgi:hypothetical protein